MPLTRPRHPTPSLQFDRFYTTDEIRTFVHDLRDAHPDLCRLESLCQSRAGTDIPLLTLNDFSFGDPSARPALLIHGGIHAHEPASAHGPLYTAVRLTENHGADGPLGRFTFHLIPRLTVDTSDFCIRTSTRIRSRTDFERREPNVIYPEDIDGNGLILSIRQPHPEGQHVVDPLEPRLMIHRSVETVGPAYRILPEGYIHDWDGGDRVLQGGLHSFLQDPEHAGGCSFDWNRNWPVNWRPDQVGAGEQRLSEPEVSALYEFIRSHTEIAAVIGYHCGKPSVIRPPASGSRSDLEPAADARLQQLAELGSRLTQTPILSLCGPDSRGKGGHSLDAIHFDLGRIAFEIELGTILNDAGLSPEEGLEMDAESQEAWMRRLLVWWDDRGQDIPLYEPWKPFDHPQLGPVAIGGLHWTVIDNPLVSGLADSLEGRYRFTLEVAKAVVS